MNYDRYLAETEEHYNKKNLSYYLMRKPADRILIPYVSQIKNAKVLEVGIGYGYYTGYYIKNHNKVKGLDVNPQLGKNTGVQIIQGTANQLKSKVKGTFHYILSFFMTEYLPYKELQQFFEQSGELLQRGGVLATTVILKKGLGRWYILLARIKGVKKYNYTMKEIKWIVHDLKDMRVRVTPLNTIMNIPFAVLVEIKKIGN